MRNQLKYKLELKFPRVSVCVCVLPGCFSIDTAEGQYEMQLLQAVAYPAIELPASMIDLKVAKCAKHFLHIFCYAQLSKHAALRIPKPTQIYRVASTQSGWQDN